MADNVYGMMASASSKLNLKQFEHLTGLIRETWEKAAGDRLRERLLVLVGRIGKEAGQMKAKQVNAATIRYIKTKLTSHFNADYT